VIACRVVSSMWETTANVRVFAVRKTVVAFVSCMELVACVDGAIAVWVTVVVQVSRYGRW
jgi:hypothetical protein